MDALEIYQHARQGTASGRGPSYYELPMVCGRKAYLTEQMQKRGDEVLRSGALAVGSYYHYLLQMWRDEKIDSNFIIDTSEVGDPDWTEAVRLFDFYTGQFERNSWGSVLGTEIFLPANSAHRRDIENFFSIYGEDCPTGAIDLLVFMNFGDIERIEKEKDIELRGPGYYIVDYKTASARTDHQGAKALYTETVQAMTYPTLWNIGGGEQVKGMIFDVIVKHKNLGANSIQTWFAPHCPSHRKIVRGAVRLARASKLKARPNPYGCYYKGYECNFLRDGSCQRM